MITLADVRDWLKGFAGADHYYIGKLDAKQEKSIGVYSRSATGAAPNIALGGLPCTKTAVKQVALLLHWTNNARETETAAQALFDAFKAAEPIQIGMSRVDYIRLMMSEPVDVGTDDNGIYERVIWMDIYYERID